MRADYAKKVIKEYDKLPYKCILIDGVWGIGKSYLVSQSLERNDNVCKLSMFGLNDAQQIFHEVFYQLGLHGKEKVQKILSNILDITSVFSDKADGVKAIMKSLIKEKELFQEISKTFDEYRIIVIDDLERMNERIKLEEFLGVVEELKKCHLVKVILIANTEELTEKDIFDRYKEKVIDRTYCITEHSTDIDWSRLNIHDKFISDFLKIHKVKNLRTLQKAQNFYDDVRINIKDEYFQEFYDEIRLICYAITVESVDKLYYKNQTDKKSSNSGITFEMKNILEIRIKSNYLLGLRSGNGLFEILFKYYKNENEITLDEIEREYQVFIHSGEKSNYYKTDEEIKKMLPGLLRKMEGEDNIVNCVKCADEYIFWNELLNIDIDQELGRYKQKIHDNIYNKVLEGKLEYLTYGIETYNLQNDTNKRLLQDIIDTSKEELIQEYVEYLHENTGTEKAYNYSCALKEFINNTYFKKIIYEKVNKLYTRNSFPVDDVNELKYRTSYNIMYVLYNVNNDELLAYCEELAKSCDNISRYRIEKIIEGLVRGY